MKDYKLVAPDIDNLLNFFERGHVNPQTPSAALAEALETLFKALRKLAPHKADKEVKTIWITVPRGTIEDFGSFEEMKDWGEVETRKEFQQRWEEEYPEPVSWYRLATREAFHKDGTLWFRVLQFGERIIANAHFDLNERPIPDFQEAAAVTLCRLLTTAAQDTIHMIEEGIYNDFVRTNLPYQFRTGVIRRTDLWKRDPSWKEYDWDGLSGNIVAAFRQLLEQGMNNSEKIGRMKSMTANDFFRACAIGYKACGYEGGEKPPVEQYFLHADGRDEGLSGRGYGLNAGPGIDLDDPDAWEEWYFRRNQHGGHPFEVIRGGNSTHVDLFVMHDQSEIDYLFRKGEISKEEHRRRTAAAGYYYVVAGKYRASEALKFYTTLSSAGLPVILSDADELIKHFDGSGCLGIVPHSVPTRYCDNLFPQKYGKIIDFIHVYSEEMTKFGDVIEWLPEDDASIHGE